MNSASDALLNKSEDKVEAARGEDQTESNVTLVELGKVTETKGGWIGAKLDNGAGLITY